MDTVVIVDGRRDDPQACTLVFQLPRDGIIIDALCQEQRIYQCGAVPVIEDGCGDDVYHLLEGNVWQTNDWWQELQTRIATLRAAQPSLSAEPRSIVVDYDVFYIPEGDRSGLKPGWYFWFLDENQNIVSEPIGPFVDVDDALRSGKVAVTTYYDHDDES